MKIVIEFGQEKFPLTWTVCDIPIAEEWFQKVKEAHISGIRENNRFYNFPGQTAWNKKSIIKDIQQCIDTIEKEYIGFFNNITLSEFDLTQDELNYLHKFFTAIRGSVDDPSKYYLEANALTKQAINDYNILIHRFESYGNGRPRLVCTFNSEFNSNIKPEYFSLFQLSNNFGDMSLNYTQIGKQIFDAYRDKDTTVDDELRPMNIFGAAFTVRFTDIDQISADITKQRITKWYIDNGFEEKLQMPVTDNRLSMGWIKVATLDKTEHTQNEILEILGKNDWINNIILRD